MDVGVRLTRKSLCDKMTLDWEQITAFLCPDLVVAVNGTGFGLTLQPKEFIERSCEFEYVFSVLDHLKRISPRLFGEHGNTARPINRPIPAYILLAIWQKCQRRVWDHLDPKISTLSAELFLMCSTFTWGDMYTVLKKHSDVGLMNDCTRSCLREQVCVLFCAHVCTCAVVPATGRALRLLDYISPSHTGKRLLLRSGARGRGRWRGEKEEKKRREL